MVMIFNFDEYEGVRFFRNLNEAIITFFMIMNISNIKYIVLVIFITRK
jgi:hypothetical protein